MNRRYIELLIGIIIFILSNILAFVFKYNKFYALLLIGLFLIFDSSYKLKNNQPLLGPKNFIYLYLLFILFAISGDLVYGIWLIKLWSYSYSSLSSYFILYLVTYPLGGFVMVYSFSLLESFIKKPKINKNIHKKALNLSKLIILVGLITLTITLLALSYQRFLVYAAGALLAWGLINYIILKNNKQNLLEKISAKPSRYIPLILTTAYIQGIIHEYPNTFAQEWIYKNMILENITLLNIPIIVFLGGWIFLLLFPYAIYELIKPSSSQP